MSNVGGHVCSGEPIRLALESSQGADGGQPVLLKAVYYAEPDSFDDSSKSLDSAVLAVSLDPSEYEVLAEIVRRGGEMTFISKCLCCNRREIAAVFGDRAKAMGAGESLKATWGAEVEIFPFEKALGDHASQDDLIIPNCGENR